MDDIWGFTPDEIRPFPALTYQIAALWGAASPVANHVMNVALHAANGLLVFAVGRAAAGLGVGAATFAALAFVLLPSQTETVAWVTGRVDSMPAAAYLIAFLLYVLWRRRQDTAKTARTELYWASVGACFVAFFTKQNTVTLLPALVLYDIVIRRSPIQLSWRWVRPYVPFTVLTLGYLVLRYMLFGDVARESQLTRSAIDYFGTLFARHALRVMFGAPADAAPAAIALATALMAVLFWRAPRQTIFFGAVWWILGIAPVFVALYESPRHVYLASMAWAMMLGLAVDLTPRRGVRRVTATVAAIVILSIYTVQLTRAVGDWNARARVSRQATIDVEREILAAPVGSLVVAVAPVRSWEWAMPFVLRPPFVSSGLEARALVVTPQALHCCRADWERLTRERLRTWLARADSPAIALRWDADTGALFRLTDREEPYLRALMAVIAETDSAASLDRAISRLGDQLPPVRR